MEKIRMITEAYSQQPSVQMVVSKEYYDNQSANTLRHRLVKKIVLEEVKIEAGSRADTFLCYVGYGFENNKIFEWRADAVNLEFFAEPPKPQI